ncbi:MAG: PUA domain-containing protein [Thermosphaera sp.]
MIKRKPFREELEEARRIAEYQFNVRGEDFIPDDSVFVFSPKTMKLRMILVGGEKYLSLRAQDYRFILHLRAGRRLNQLLPHPFLRVYVKPEYSVFIRKGGNLFSKHVLMADPGIRPEDEVLVLDGAEVIAVGRAILPGGEMAYYKRGEAIRIREYAG